MEMNNLNSSSEPDNNKTKKVKALINYIARGGDISKIKEKFTNK